MGVVNMLTINQNKETPLPTDRNWRFKPCEKKTICHAQQINEPFEVHTLEGVMRGKPGDFLMVGVDGEFYPCDRDIFERTYRFCDGVVGVEAKIVK